MTDTAKPKSQPLTFNDLKLETIVIELRYSFAFILWDITGEIWHELEKKLPGSFVLGNASPSSVSVSYEGKYDISIEQERFAISSSHPKIAFPEFLNILKVVFDTVVDKLQIEVFNRIGFRQIFVKEYSSIKKTVEALSTIPSIVVPQKLVSGHETDFIAPGMTIRIEDDAKGAFFNLRGLSRNFEVSIPPVFRKESEVEQKVFEQFLLSFDIDFYTKVEITIGQLSITDWVKQASETVKRDAGKFF